MVDIPAGEVFSDYEIVQLIRKGGTSTTYLARHTRLNENAVLKTLQSELIELGYASQFENEAYIHSHLKHQNIAELLDYGNIHGVPYLVIEHVDGGSIVEYCKSRGLGVRERLKLLVQVCHGLQFAHEHAVFHGDLKPSNIHVARGGIPKIIDFGASRIDVKDCFSYPWSNQFLTHKYASPERVKGAKSSVSSDIYSLGILMRELLVEPQGICQEQVTAQSQIKAIIARATGGTKQEFNSTANLAASLQTVIDQWKTVSSPFSALKRKKLVRKSFANDDECQDALAVGVQFVLHKRRDVLGIAGIHSRLPLLSAFTSIFVGDQEESQCDEVERKLETYFRSSKTLPLSMAVFGLPGSGKSMAVKRVAAQRKIDWLSFDTTQVRTSDDIVGILEFARKDSLSGTLPIVFFDELDVPLGHQYIAWLKFYIKLLEEESAIGTDIEPGYLILVFPELLRESGKESGELQTDREDGYANLLVGESETLLVFRRAVLLRSLINELANLEAGYLTNEVIRTLLDPRCRFQSGIDSMRAIIEICTRSNGAVPDEQVCEHIQTDDELPFRDLSKTGGGTHSKEQ
ncbi:MAG: protein kinase [Planctomycetales bacterium]|nr:protein kinase [Planctomycetales bacterium]